MAAVLRCGDDAVLSHGSAAALWGVATARGAIEVTVPRDTRSHGAIRRHRARLPADEITVREGIPVTSVSRTLFDLAAAFPVDRLEAGMRKAEFLRLRDRVPCRPCSLATPGTVATRICGSASSG